MPEEKAAGQKVKPAEAEPKHDPPAKVIPPPNPPSVVSNVSTPRQTPDTGFGAESIPKP